MNVNRHRSFCSFSYNIILCFCLPQFVSATFQVSCGEGWAESLQSGTCIRLSGQEKQSWYKARATCKKAGGDLVKIVDSAMNVHIAGLLKLETDEFFIGLSGHATKKDFKWLDEKFNASYVNWGPGEPNSRDRVCAEMNFPAQVFADGRWTDTSCTDEHRFICEKGPALCSPGWIPSAASRTCVRPYHTKVRWSDARTTCKNQDGDLVTIRDSQMYNFVRDQVAYDEGQTYWIGWSDRKHEDEFQRFDSLNEGCAWVRFEYGSLENGTGIDCFERSKFICERFAACEKQVYGMLCPHNCSSNCVRANNTCDRRSGSCLYGCDVGYRGDNCDSVCANGTYGLDCVHNCSSHCGGQYKSCDNRNGTCSFGCVDGYLRPWCNTAIPSQKDTGTDPNQELGDKLATIAASIAILLIAMIVVGVLILGHQVEAKMNEHLGAGEWSSPADYDNGQPDVPQSGQVSRVYSLEEFNDTEDVSADEASAVSGLYWEEESEDNADMSG